MSDDEFFSDDDHYFFFDDGAVDYVDDLAEHTMHSPVWQDHELIYDSIEDITDWEYYSDDFYDHEPPRKRRRANGGGDSGRDNSEGREDAGNSNVAAGKRILRPSESIPALSLGDPANDCADEENRAKGPILWKSGFYLNDVSPPKAIDGQGEKVALLKDWRDRFKASPLPIPSLGYPHHVKRKGSRQTMVAVVIGQQYNDNSYEVNGISKHSKVQAPKASKRVHFALSPNDTSDELTEPSKRLKSTRKANGSTPSPIANSSPNISTKPSRQAPKHTKKPNGIASGTTNGSVTPSIADDTTDEIAKPSKRLKRPLKANGVTMSNLNGSLAPSTTNDTLDDTSKPSKQVSKPTAKANGTTLGKAKAPLKDLMLDTNPDPKVKPTNLRKRKAPPSPEPTSSANGTGALDLQSNGTKMATRKRSKKTS